MKRQEYERREKGYHVIIGALAVNGIVDAVVRILDLKGKRAKAITTLGLIVKIVAITAEVVAGYDMISEAKKKDDDENLVWF